MEEINKKIDERDIFLRGNHVMLKVLTENDVLNSDWFGWFNDEETTLHMQKHYFPNTLDLQSEFLKNLKKDMSKIQLGIVPHGENDIIGVISLQNINYINSNADISMIIGEKSYRQLILAQEAMQLMLNHAFFTLNLHKVYGGYLETLEDWGLFLKKRFGFIDEGVWREHAFKNGKYLNICRLGLLKMEYVEHMNKQSTEEKENEK